MRSGAGFRGGAHGTARWNIGTGVTGCRRQCLREKLSAGKEKVRGREMGPEVGVRGKEKPQ